MKNDIDVYSEVPRISDGRQKSRVFCVLSSQKKYSCEMKKEMFSYAPHCKIER